jgi:hypothetical protein
LDKTPYYGGSDYRVNTNVPQDGIQVPIEMKDLVNTNASPENIKNLQMELLKLEGHQPLTDIYRSGMYVKDPEPYYNPTQVETEKQKKYLRDTIDNMRNEINTREFPKIQFGVERGQTSVQNPSNANTELANEHVAKNMWYPVNREEPTRDANRNAYPDGNRGPLTDAEVSRITLGSKYVEPKVETKYHPQEVSAVDASSGTFTTSNFRNDTAKLVVNQINPTIVENIKAVTQTATGVQPTYTTVASNYQEKPVQEAKIIREAPKQVEMIETKPIVQNVPVQKVIERELPQKSVVEVSKQDQNIEPKVAEEKRTEPVITATKKDIPIKTSLTETNTVDRVTNKKLGPEVNQQEKTNLDVKPTISALKTQIKPEQQKEISQQASKLERVEMKQTTKVEKSGNVSLTGVSK